MIKRKRSAGRFWLGFLLTCLVLAGGVMLTRYALNRYYHTAYPMEYKELVDTACVEKELDRALVYAIIRTESGFRPDAVSNVGARGLMQMMPDTFEWVCMRKGEEKKDPAVLFDPAVNIEYGTSMLRLLFDEFHTEVNVLCAYHAGWGSVHSWLNSPDYAPDGENITKIPFRDTTHYVSKVLKAAEIYRKLYNV